MRKIKILIIGFLLAVFASNVFAQSNKTVSFTGFGGGLPSSPVLIDEAALETPLVPVSQSVPSEKSGITMQSGVIIAAASVAVVAGTAILVACALSGVNVSGVTEAATEECCSTLVDELSEAIIETCIEITCDAVCETVCADQNCAYGLIPLLIP